MKIFIKDCKFNKSLDKYYINSESYLELYSKEGIFKVNNSFVKLNIIDKNVSIFENYYKSLTLLVDHSTICYEKVSQLPVDHISLSIKKCYFGTNPKSKLKLVIEYNTELNTELNTEVNVFPFSQECNMLPINFYFEILDEIDINNDSIKQELTVFLSLLN